jgi:hypothetical protein
VRDHIPTFLILFMTKTTMICDTPRGRAPPANELGSVAVPGITTMGGGG